LRNKNTKIPFLSNKSGMLLHRRNFLPAVCIVLLSLACKNSDSWLARTWHNTRAHYNSYFNAEQTWLTTELTMREGYVDDYRSFIELYNYGSAETLKGNQATMDAVIKQLSTIIDKHPKSKWIDDCYLLMAKSYFLKGDFIAAADIFEYVNSNFKDPTVVFSARLWIFRCLYAKGKLSEAENLAVSLKNDANFPKNLLPELNKSLGAIYLRNNKPSQAVEFLELSLKGIKGKLDRYRMHYALAQSYQRIKEWDKANTHYAKVKRMNPPYEMAFNAEINRVEILTYQQQNYVKSNRILKRMLQDDKNIDYYSQIYYRLGLNELRGENNIKALGYFNQSLRTGASDKVQSTTTYLTLGDYFFENKDYERAGLYYDSANNLLDEKHPDYETIAKRSAILGDLLKNLLIVKRQDSLLRLAKDPILREKTIDRIIEYEKKQALVIKNKPQAPAPPTNPGFDPADNGSLTPSSFPFYNVNNRTRGIQDFQKQWGIRTNRDFWRINAKKSTVAQTGSDANGNDSAQNVDTLPANTPENRKKYYKDIPLTKETQKAAEKMIEDALFAAAGVYQNSLNAPKDAVNMYQVLLKRYPNTAYEAQALYELAKLSKTLGDEAGYESYKAKLEEKHPESFYLRLLKDPNAKAEPDKNGPGVARKEIENLYTDMYNAYLTEKYDEAIKIKQVADEKYAGNTLQARFDYIFALCLIKKGETAKGMGALQQVVSDYAGTEIAVRAKATIDAYERILHPPAADTTLVADSLNASAPTGLWKKWDGNEELYFILSYRKGANSNLLRAGLNDFNKTNFVFENLEVSTVRAFGESVYLTVANFSKPLATQEYLKYVISKPDFFSSKGLFEYEMAWISKTNYSLLVVNNRINSYVDFFKTDLK